ncbi:MAG TPA: hypothetical protein VHK88_19610 [Aquihabitans sp.]|jgi:hypothetical protein|nr:hypothetical protein [Aquihabitans sp.]
MSGNPRRKQQGRRRGGNKPKPVDLWRPVPQLPDPEPIVPATDPGVLLRSLGSPPLHGQGAQAEHAFELVVRRSAMLATALAATADLLAEPDDADG